MLHICSRFLQSRQTKLIILPSLVLFVCFQEMSLLCSYVCNFCLIKTNDYIKRFVSIRFSILVAKLCAFFIALLEKVWLGKL